MVYVTVQHIGITMTTSIKALSLLLLFNVIYVHAMECEISKQKRVHNCEKEIILCTEKDSCSLLELPDEIIGKVLNYTSKDDIFNAITLLIRLSYTCKKCERLREPHTIKTILGLDQNMLDDSLWSYVFFEPSFESKPHRESTPFFKLLISMDAQANRYCTNLISCVRYTKNAYVVDYFITHHDNHVDQQDEHGKTPLYCAVNLDKPDILRVLLKHKANMYLADKLGDTPAYLAITNDRFECLKALIEHGLDTTIKYAFSYSYQPTLAEWAKFGATCYKKKVDQYNEIYRLVTKEDISKPWQEKSGSELFNENCVIS